MSNLAVCLSVILLVYYVVVCGLLMKRFKGYGAIHRASQTAILVSQVLLAELLMACCIIYDFPAWEAFSLACACIACGPVDAFSFRMLDDAFSAHETRLRLGMVQQQLQAQEESRERARLESQAAASIRAHMLDQLYAAADQLVDENAAGATCDLERAIELAGGRPSRMCSHHAADALLQTKSHMASQNQVAFEVSCDIPADLAIPDIDLCAVLANLIDNALHAAVKLPADDRLVRVQARLKGRYLSIVVRNSFHPSDETAQTESAARRKRAAAVGKLLGVEHGWGRDIVRGIAAKHGGAFESSRDSEGLYVASVVMLACPATSAKSGDAA